MLLGVLPSQVLRLPDDFQHVAFDFELVSSWLEERRKRKAAVAEVAEVESENVEEKLRDMEVWERRQRGLR